MKFWRYIYCAVFACAVFEIQAQTTAVVEGSLGIGEENPAARIEVSAEINELPLLLNINGARKFTMNSNGGVAIGGPFITLPQDGLYVAGKTGIGTTGPNAKLQVNHNGSGSDPQLLLFETDPADFGRINYGTSGSAERWIISARTSGSGDTSMRFHHSTVGDIMTLTSLERVGIGTSSPTGKLHLLHDGTGSNPQLSITESSTSDFGRINYLNTGSTDRWTISARTSASHDTTMRFYHSTAGDVMTISGRKHVGIGTVIPEVKLHIKGGTDTSPSDGGYLVLGETTGTNLSIDNNEIMARSNGTTSTLHVQVEGGDFKIHDGLPAAQEFIVQDDGDVGIGTASPDSKLEINGPESDGTTGSVHIVTGTHDMVLDGNEIDTDADMYLNANTSQDIILVDGGGSVGIGDNNPAAKLEIDASGMDPLRVRLAGSTRIRVHDTGGISLGTSQDAAAEEIRIDVGVSSEDLFFRKATCGGDPCNPRMIPESSGSWELGTAQAPLDEVNANNFFGIYGPPSDRRIKENIRPIENPWDLIKQLTGHRYGFTKAYYYDQTGHDIDEFKRQNQWGLIAQEVEGVLPELVMTDGETDRKSLDYVSLIPILIEGFKDQQELIERQQAQIEELIALVRNHNPPD